MAALRAVSHSLHTLLITFWKLEGGRGRGGGRECKNTVVMVGRVGGQVTSQWYHGISSSTWPALHQQPPGPLPTTTRGTYLALAAAERCNPWPMTNTMSAAQHMKLLLYNVQWQLYNVQWQSYISLAEGEAYAHFKDKKNPCAIVIRRRKINHSKGLSAS